MNVSVTDVEVDKRWNHVLELALRRVLAEHSDSPMYFVFPALRMESRAGIESSRGVSTFRFPVSSMVGHGVRNYKTLTRVNAVEIVKIWGESKALNRSLNV